MNITTAKNILIQLLQPANITINGDQPWDIQVHNEQLYQRILRDGSLGLGESYMDGWWDCQNLDQFFERIFGARLEEKIKKNYLLLFKMFLLKFYNLQTKKRAFIVGKKHYDLGNELFQHMLDTNMNYTCAYWKNAHNLDEAQLAKLELTCQKLLLKPGMRLLDIGCGFGTLAKYAAERYGVSVVGVTISQQQYNFAKKNCAGLPIEIRLQDYRDINEPFDRICSLGMFEHVGPANYDTYMKIVTDCLNSQGIFLLHTIGKNKLSPVNEWTKKYIFPNGELPTIQNIAKSTEGILVMEDWHNFGADYDKTLMAWQHNFTTHWEQIKAHYDERFYRMWNYYLLSAASGFRTRTLQLWQIVFSKQGIAGGYQAPRSVELTDQKSLNYAKIPHNALP
jgi:cyclopropane-fatty-acyl-phospholipid synthase